VYLDKTVVILIVILAVAIIPAVLFVGFIGAIIYMIIQSGGQFFEVRLYNDRIMFHARGIGLFGWYDGAFMLQIWLFTLCAVSFLISLTSFVLFIKRRRLLKRRDEQTIKTYTI